MYPLSPRNQDQGALCFVQLVVMILLFCLQFLISFEVHRLTLYFILNFICICAIICVLYYKKDRYYFSYFNSFLKIILNETILPSLKYILKQKTTKILINGTDNPKIIATGEIQSLFAIGSFPLLLCSVESLKYVVVLYLTLIVSSSI